MPRAIVIVPSVAINGGSLHSATSNPFAAPMARQHTSVITTAAHGFTPLVISVALIIQLMPISEPIDKSMLPVMSTYDCPIPISSIGAIWRKRFPTLRLLKNTGFTMPNAILSTISPAVTVSTCPMPRISKRRFTGFCFCISLILLFPLFRFFY